MNPQTFASLELLPVQAYKQQILTAVDLNQVTIITAETGAGKSTQVPQYLAEHGYKKIIVTQPRILAARNLSGRVRQEYSWRTGYDASALVGYRTAHERDDSPETVILYCTDGLQLVRELAGAGSTEGQVLILDEVHEWNENMEVLVAWAKKRCLEEPTFKIVVMSATIDAQSLAEYFGAGLPIEIPGRGFPVAKSHGKDLVFEMTTAIKQRPGCNMLVFLPGKAEIESVAAEVQTAISDDIPILPLHSQLSPDEQQMAFNHYPNGKIILTTNIAQTSVTIDDIDVVIDSGLERRAEVRSGVEGLFIEEISRADCMQRAGRAGRTKEGVYVLAQLGILPCSTLENRPDYGVPEILRKHIDRLILRLSNIQIDIEELDFYHKPSRNSIKRAKHTLISLGAMSTRQEVTDIGREMERFPVESEFARMLVAAKKCSESIQYKVAAIIALQEAGGIFKGGPRYTKWRQYSHQSRSDLLAHYEVFLAYDSINPMDYEDFGIIDKNAKKAEEILQRLYEVLKLTGAPLSPVLADELDELLKCIVAGQLHQLWAVSDNRQALDVQTGKSRELSSTSVVKNAALVTGTPFDLQVPTAAGLETLHLVNGLTIVEPAWLSELAPDTFKIRQGNVYFNPQFGTLATRSQLQFGNISYDLDSSPLLTYSRENEQQFLTQYSIWLHEQLEHERRDLQSVNHKKLPEIALKQIQQQVRQVVVGAVSLLELSKVQRVQLHKLRKLETFYGSRMMQGLTQPGSYRHGKSRRQNWKFDRQRTNKRRQDR